jgi:hypothetical protein
MHPTKIAATIALLVAIAATGYFCFVMYQDIVLLDASINVFNGIDDHFTLRYAISGGIAIVSIITSFALFESAKRPGEPSLRFTR